MTTEASHDEFRKSIASLHARQRKFWLRYFGAIFLIAAVLWLGWTPVVRPWTQERAGYANLKKAEFENQIGKEQADAERDAAVLRARAIEIVGEAAKQYPEYRNQELIGGFAKALKEGKIKQTYYITTEHNIPVLPEMKIAVHAPLVGLPVAPTEVTEGPESQ